MYIGCNVIARVDSTTLHCVTASSFFGTISAVCLIGHVLVMISIDLWRARIGLYNSKSSSCSSHCATLRPGPFRASSFCSSNVGLMNELFCLTSILCLMLGRSLVKDFLVILLLVVISQQLIKSGDVELNPGPTLTGGEKLVCCN